MNGKSPEREILEATEFVVNNGLVKGTWGNISLRRGDLVYITPTGIPYDRLSEDDISVVSMDGKHLFGKKPSSELPTHLRIYEVRKDVSAIVHTHPIYSTVVSITLDIVPPIVEDAVMILGTEIKVAEYAFPGTEELAENVVKALGENNAVILRNHGLITVGSSMYEALTASVICEKTAEIYLRALSIGGVREISRHDARKLREKYLISYKFSPQ